MMNNTLKLAGLVVLSLNLIGCATVTTGQNQSVSVSTGDASSATCELSNDSGKWFVASTPGSVTVKRDYSDMTVACKKGNKSGSTTVKSHTKAMALGNVIVGGVIGTAVDIGTGSAYDYPTNIDVKLK